MPKMTNIRIRKVNKKERKLGIKTKEWIGFNTPPQSEMSLSNKVNDYEVKESGSLVKQKKQMV